MLAVSIKSPDEKSIRSVFWFRKKLVDSFSFELQLIRLINNYRNDHLSEYAYQSTVIGDDHVKQRQNQNVFVLEIVDQHPAHKMKEEKIRWSNENDYACVCKMGWKLNIQSGRRMFCQFDIQMQSCLCLFNTFLVKLPICKYFSKIKAKLQANKRKQTIESQLSVVVKYFVAWQSQPQLCFFLLWKSRHTLLASRRTISVSLSNDFVIPS